MDVVRSLDAAELVSLEASSVGQGRAFGMMRMLVLGRPMARVKGQTYRHRKDVNGEAPETQTRPCLRCRRAFEREGNHHRLCLQCINRDGEVSPYVL